MRDLLRTDRGHGSLSTFADHVHDGVAVYDLAGNLLYWNVAARTITGWSASSDEAVSLRERPSGLAEIRPGKWVESRRVSLAWQGAPAEAILFNDVTAERRLADHLRQLRDVGLVDPLTGLIGERLLRDHTRRALSLAQRDGRPAGVLWLDLHRYVGAGHEAAAIADEVLRQYARKVELSIRVSDVAARPAPGSLAVMLTALESANDLRVVAVRLLLLLAAPAFVEGRERSVAATIGGAVYPLDADSADGLIDEARRVARDASRAGTQIAMAGPR
jgi:diguanylate cyclase (GGDEF)-like protein